MNNQYPEEKPYVINHGREIYVGEIIPLTEKNIEVAGRCTGRNCSESCHKKLIFMKDCCEEVLGFINEVDDIYVSQRSRDAGLGSLLLDKLLDVAKENGIERSLIYSSTKDINSIISFYKKHDYKTWYIQMYK
ncbi:GNAT family N-acetyltransferase [Proteiniborus sp. MB09-C3]|uniref:GNAT family N-acetyltransferase n=1 Tax=Proteiniborus sp. MB09-C3 TaxID=3050072 RepID=UPI00255433E1|nr:GNAT family N-acetyltransferase [Proteiniborus sp. MB09-C3]WIV11527.1 GNAT family N-acetyltransferase [Proteiniborus sp. MB09-C3]